MYDLRYIDIAINSFELIFITVGTLRKLLNHVQGLTAIGITETFQGAKATKSSSSAGQV